MVNQSITDQIFLRVATLVDIAELESLLNRCYRNDEGWTNEAALIAGIRTTQAELKRVIEDPNQYVFVYPKTVDGQRSSVETGELLACICVSGQSEVDSTNHDNNDNDNDNDSDDNAKNNDKQALKAYIGMFAVQPDLQGQGVGDTILNAAETFATRHFGSETHPCRLTMSILNHRPELLAYYQRRGYQLTGKSDPFPVDGNNGEPLRDDLRLLELEKLS